MTSSLSSDSRRGTGITFSLEKKPYFTYIYIRAVSDTGHQAVWGTRILEGRKASELRLVNVPAAAWRDSRLSLREGASRQSPEASLR